MMKRLIVLVLILMSLSPTTTARADNPDQDAFATAQAAFFALPVDQQLPLQTRNYYRSPTPENLALANAFTQKLYRDVTYWVCLYNRGEPEAVCYQLWLDAAYP